MTAKRVGSATISLVLTTVAVTGSLAPHEADGPRQAPPIVIATGSPLGVYHEYGEDLAGLLVRELAPVRVMATAGSVETCE